MSDTNGRDPSDPSVEDVSRFFRGQPVGGQPPPVQTTDTGQGARADAGQETSRKRWIDQNREAYEEWLRREEAEAEAASQATSLAERQHWLRQQALTQEEQAAVAEAAKWAPVLATEAQAMRQRRIMRNVVTFAGAGLALFFFASVIGGAPWKRRPPPAPRPSPPPEPPQQRPEPHTEGGAS